MRKGLAIVITAVLFLGAAPAFADLLALEVDAQASYLRLDNIALPDGSGETGTIGGFGAGVRGRLQILFLNALVDYHHLLNPGNAEILHIGLGAGYKTDSLPVFDLYVQGSIGILMMMADGSAFIGDNVSNKLDFESGGQLRVGGGIDIPFAGDWFAFGVGADVGGHYITGETGYDFSVNVHFGLRI